PPSRRPGAPPPLRRARPRSLRRGSIPPGRPRSLHGPPAARSVPVDLTVRQFLSRYGPSLALIATLIGLVLLVPSNTKSGPSNVAAGGGATPSTAQGNTPTGGGAAPTAGTPTGGTAPGGAATGGSATGGSPTGGGSSGATAAGGGAVSGGAGETPGAPGAGGTASSGEGSA